MDPTNQGGLWRDLNKFHINLRRKAAMAKLQIKSNTQFDFSIDPKIDNFTIEINRNHLWKPPFKDRKFKLPSN